MIRYFGVGHSRLSRGSQLRILALIEHPTLEPSPNLAQEPILEIVGEDFHRQLEFKFITTVVDTPGVEIRAYGLLLGTIDIPAGGYDLRMHAGDDYFTLDELVWILEDADRISLLEEELFGIPLDNASLLEYDPSISTQSLQRIIRNAFSEKLTGFLRMGHLLESNPAIDISVEVVPDISANIMAYIAEVFADECRNLLIHGAETFRLSVSSAHRMYRISLYAQLDEYSTANESDFERSDLVILAKMIEANISGMQFVLAVEIREGVVSLTAEVHHSQRAMVAT